MSKQRPRRIFKKTKDPYVIIGGKKVPIKGLSKSSISKLLNLGTKTKVKPNKYGSLENIIKSLLSRTSKTVKKRRSRETSGNEKIKALQANEQALKDKIRELTVAQQVTKIEQTKKDIEGERQKTENQLEENKKALVELKRLKNLPDNIPKSIEDEPEINQAIRRYPSVAKELEKRFGDLAVSKTMSDRARREAEREANIAKRVAEEIKEDKRKEVEVNKIYDAIYNKENAEVGFKLLAQNTRGKVSSSLNEFTGIEDYRGKPKINEFRRAMRQNKEQIKDFIMKEYSRTDTLVKSLSDIDVGQGNGKEGDGLYDYELNEVMDNIPGYYGALGSEDITSTFKTILKNKPKIFSFIYLIRNYDNGETNHWVSVFVDTVFDMSIGYYDPYGKEASNDLKKNILDLIEDLEIEHYLKWKHNAVQYQEVNTSNCGIFAMNYIVMRTFGHSHKDASVYDETKADQTRKVLYELF